MPFKHIHPNHRKSGKRKYRVRNWSEYNLALENRGRIVFVLVDDITDRWYANPEKRHPAEEGRGSLALCGERPHLAGRTYNGDP